jgi:hypothetical protein
VLLLELLCRVVVHGEATQVHMLLVLSLVALCEHILLSMQSGYGFNE